MCCECQQKQLSTAKTRCRRKIFVWPSQSVSGFSPSRSAEFCEVKSKTIVAMKYLKRPEESGADDDIEEEFLSLVDHPRGTKIGCHPGASQCHLEGGAGQTFCPTCIAGHNPFTYYPSKYPKFMNLISKQNDRKYFLLLDMLALKNKFIISEYHSRVLHLF